MQKVNRWLGQLLCFCLLILGATMGAGVHAQTPYVTLTQTPAPPNGIEEIYFGNDLSAQIKHSIDTTNLQIFPSAVKPGDFGTFVVSDNVLYAPDFQAPGRGGTATGNIGPFIPFTPQSQSPVVGSGTFTSPYEVTTVVKLVNSTPSGDTGLSITQHDSFVNGNEYFTTNITLTNDGNTDKTVTVYRALDCYLGGSDSGYGFASGTDIACALRANNNPPGRLIQLIPLTAGSTYLQDRYNSVWTAISTHQMFSNQCRQCNTQVDNGIGLSWSVTVPAGGSTTVSHNTLFSPSGKLPLAINASATPATVNAGEQTTYTITVANPNRTSVTLTALNDILPAGFSYVPGTITGDITLEPSITGQTLSWTTPLTIAASGTATVRLTAQVAPSVASGIYTSNLSGQANDDYSVQSHLSAAPVTVFNPASPIPVQALLSVSPSTAAAGDTVTYRVTLANTAAIGTVLDTVQINLPADFEYQAGTTTGVLSTNPAVAGLNLTWAGPVNLSANASRTFNFEVRVGSTVNPGTYPASVSGTSSTATVTGSTAVAPVTVPDSGGPSNPGNNGAITPVPLGPWLPLLLAGVIAVLAGLRRR